MDSLSSLVRESLREIPKEQAKELLDLMTKEIIPQQAIYKCDRCQNIIHNNHINEVHHYQFDKQSNNTIKGTFGSYHLCTACYDVFVNKFMNQHTIQGKTK